MKLISVKLESGEEIDATLNTSSSKVAKLDLVCSKENASHWLELPKTWRLSLSAVVRSIRSMQV